MEYQKTFQKIHNKIQRQPRMRKIKNISLEERQKIIDYIGIGINIIVKKF